MVSDNRETEMAVSTKFLSRASPEAIKNNSGAVNDENVVKITFLLQWLIHSLREPGLILGLRPANERRRYKVTPSLIGWAQT